MYWSDILITLLKPFLRSRLKLILSVIIFLVIIVCMCFVLQYKETISSKIYTIENKTNNREFSLIVDDVNIVNNLENDSRIENVDYTEISGHYYVKILVHEIEYVDSIKEYLQSMNITISSADDKYMDELDVYQSTKLLFNIFLIALLILLIIIIYIQVKLLINWDTNNIVLLKVLGYRLYKLALIEFCKIITIIITSTFFSIIVIFIINVFVIDEISLFKVVIAALLSIIIVIIQQPFFIHKIEKISVTTN